EDDYPFKGIQQTCNNDIVAAAGFDGYQLVSPGDEQQLLQAVAQQPVAASIVVGHDFRAFKG
ncbi:cysteine protease, partial [Trifolium medium]|nr:cysteine protease [Trifolium medium]